MTKRILKARQIENLENTSFAAPYGASAHAHGAEELGQLQAGVEGNALQTTPAWTVITVTTALATSDLLCGGDPPPTAIETVGVTCGDDVVTCGNNNMTCGSNNDTCGSNVCSCDCFSGVCCITPAEIGSNDLV